MLIVGLLASPRRGGNSELLLDAALSAARAAGATTEKVVLNELRFAPCQACPDAPTDGSCRVADDLQPVYALLDRSDALILASPLHFGSVSAQAKMLIDRQQCRWMARVIHHTLPDTISKRALFLCPAASDRRDFYANARAVAGNFFATLGARVAGELFCPGLEAAGAVAGRPECLAQAAALGRLLTATDPG